MTSVQELHKIYEELSRRIQHIGIALSWLRIPAQCRPGSPVILGHLC